MHHRSHVGDVGVEVAEAISHDVVPQRLGIVGADVEQFQAFARIEVNRSTETVEVDGDSLRMTRDPVELVFFN